MDNDGKDEPDSEEYMDNKDKAIKKAIKNESVRKTTVKEVKKWFKTLEENRYKRTYNSDARRVSWLVNNNLSEDYEAMPISMKKKWPKAAYKRERFLAKEFVKHLKGETKLRESIRKIIKSLITEGGDGILEPIQKAKSQRDAINYVKKFLKDEKRYGGDFGDIKNIKFVGNVSSEDKLDKMGMRYEDRSAVVGVVDGEYWWSIWRRS